MLCFINKIFQVGVRVDTFILNFIEKNNLVKITSKDESLFLQGKIHQSFFMYLIIEIEEKYGIFLKMKNW